MEPEKFSQERAEFSPALKTRVGYAYTTLWLHRIYARIMSTNPDSVKVLLKCRFTHEGTVMDHVFKWGIFFDIEVYGILNVQK